MTARKTVEIQKLLNFANGYLSAKGGTPEARRGVIAMIENALFFADRYRGFRYLSEEDLYEGDKPGIRWTDDPAEYRIDTDETRRFYA